MGLQPIINKEKRFALKQCSRCQNTFGPESFAPTHSLFYPDGVLPICDSCVNDWLADQDDKWDAVDKLCQYADVPFVPKQWEQMEQLTGNTFHKYAEVMMKDDYEGMDWSTQYARFRELKSQGNLDSDLPLIDDELKKTYRERWGEYDDEGYQYLENLYKGLITTQSVNGALQVDQAIKICKISYEIDKKIEEGSDFDKLLASYDKLVKAAEFTPKNVKNINDFDTIGELVHWLEKKGWKNKYYDNVTRDVVDETMLNIQNFNRKLYVNESGIGEDINARIEALKLAKSMESDNYYGTDLNVDLDKYDNDGYEKLIGMENDEFQSELGGES